MALPLPSSSRQLEERGSISKVAVQETSASPEKESDEKGEEEEELRPMASFMPPVSDKHRGLGGLMSTHVWRNHIIWRAGVSLAS